MAKNILHVKNYLLKSLWSIWYFFQKHKILYSINADHFPPQFFLNKNIIATEKIVIHKTYRQEYKHNCVPVAVQTAESSTIILRDFSRYLCVFVITVYSWAKCFCVTPSLSSTNTLRYGDACTKHMLRTQSHTCLCH